MDTTSAVHTRVSVESPIEEETRKTHRDAALQQLTSLRPTIAGPTPKSREFQRQYRRAAGRSGGEFEATRDASGTSYSYVWPDPGENMLDRLIAVTNMATREAFDEIEADVDGLKTSPMSKRGIRSAEQETRRNTPEDDAQSVEDGVSFTDNSSPTGARRKLRKLNRKISRWLLNIKEDLPQQGAIESGEAGSGNAKSRLRHTTSRSPVKEQLAMEADRASKHEDINKDFFTPPQRKKKSFARLRGLFDKERPDAEVSD